MILLASLLNALILAFLLTTAVHESLPGPLEERAYAPLISSHNAASATPAPAPASIHPFVSASDAKVIHLDPWPQDEVDHALQPYLAKQEAQVFEMRETPALINEPSTPFAAPAPAAASKEGFQEVIIKQGDALDKLARRFGVPVKEIKRINKLTSDRLSIDQVLMVPKNTGTQEVASVPKAVTSTSTPPAATTATAVATKETQNYVMKSGDNPWKIARAHKMKLEDLLELNNLTEETARNLKPGDSIRVHVKI